MWRVKFEPGEVKAVSRKDGKTVCEQTIRTAGQPAAVRLSVDYQGKDLCFVCVDIVDADGNLCPWAENQVYFTTDGNAQVIATDNGCQTSMEKFVSPQRKAFFGRCLAVVRGEGTLKAQAIGLKDGTLKIND
jgi:beta-galactosidase